MESKENNKNKNKMIDCVYRWAIGTMNYSMKFMDENKTTTREEIEVKRNKKIKKINRSAWIRGQWKSLSRFGYNVQHITTHTKWTIAVLYMHYALLFITIFDFYFVFSHVETKRNGIFV